MRIEVTQKNIENGIVHCHFCPIALALNRALPGSRPSVMSDGLWVTVGGERREFYPPEECEEFIDAFDEGETVHPFTFELPVEL